MDLNLPRMLIIYNLLTHFCREMTENLKLSLF